MAKVNGFGGYVNYNSVEYNVESWSATCDAEILDTTSVGDAGFQTNIKGVEKCEGSAKLYVDAAALPTGSTHLRPGNSATMTLELSDTGKLLSFTARISSIQFENSAKGVLTFTVNFTSNGSITYPS